VDHSIIAMSTATMTLSRHADPVPLELIAPMDTPVKEQVTVSFAEKPVEYSNWQQIVRVWASGRISWINVFILTFTPIIAIIGAFTTELQTKTMWWSLFYFAFSGMGITAGYHRLFAHRSYQASAITRLGFMLAGSSALEGSIKWWCGGHRIHHRYTDTPKDPYNAHGGFWYAHIGWMLISPDPKQFTKSDIRDLNADPIVRWQHTYYLFIGPFMAFVFPTLVAGLLWNDWYGGYFYAGAMRLVFTHHSTFCVNSVAHYFGEHTFDDDRTPRDSIITALLTFGEGYHNFHHEFPNDYRNGIKWYDYDPTKWLILALHYLGFVKALKEFPLNEIKRGVIYMKEKKLAALKTQVRLPKPAEHLPLMTWMEYILAVKSGEKLILVDGIVHDVTEFVPLHPGGEAILKTYLGTDASKIFHGRTEPVLYKHSHAAMNILSNMRKARMDPATVPPPKAAGKKEE